VRPCLAFKEKGEEAVNLYVSLLTNSRITSIGRSDGSGPIPAGALMHCIFELNGTEYTAFDGGPTFKFAEGLSIMVACETQAEIDRLWTGLTADGGEEGPCGWCKDRFGLSWQVIPTDLGQMLGDPSSGDCGAAAQAMFQMKKLDVESLRRAYNGRD
jgi:predicted 3-demethylubiquinone-9 3-methyltransferase (glyoxalase superfamily)